MKNKKGITLIALVITIIVLLILAGVALSLVVGEDGIVERAINAGKVYDIAGAKEQVNTIAADYASGFYEAKYVTGDTGGKDLQGYISNKFAESYAGENAGTKIGDYSVTVDTTKNTVTITDTKDTTNKAKGTIKEDGTIEWGEAKDYSALYAEIGSSDITYTPSGTYDWLGKYATSYPETEEGEGDNKKTVIKNGSTYYTNIKLKTGDPTIPTTPAYDKVEDMSITKWKILKTDGDTVYLVPSSSAYATPSLTLHGAQGYNNAVNLLDEACSSLYGTPSKEITAESIDMDLIEGLLKEVADADSTNTKWATAKANYTNSNSSYSHLDDNNQVKNAYSTGNSKYPVIYSQEVSGLGLSSKPASKIERSAGTSTTSYIGAITNATTGIQPYQTYYRMNYSDFFTALGKYSSLILPKTTGTNYWVASRCVNTTTSSICSFRVRVVYSGELGGSTVFINSNGYSRPLFPVVSLSSNLIKKDGSGNYYVDIQ